MNDVNEWGSGHTGPCQPNCDCVISIRRRAFISKIKQCAGCESLSEHLRDMESQRDEVREEVENLKLVLQFPQSQVESDLKKERDELKQNLEDLKTEALQRFLFMSPEYLKLQDERDELLRKVLEAQEFQNNMKDYRNLVIEFVAQHLEDQMDGSDVRDDQVNDFLDRAAKDVRSLKKP